MIARAGNVTPQGAAIALEQAARWTPRSPAQVNGEDGGQGDPEVELLPRAGRLHFAHRTGDDAGLTKGTDGARRGLARDGGGVTG